MELARFKPTDPTAAILAAVAKDGGAIVESVLRPAELETLDRELMPHIARTSKSDGIFHGFETTRVGGLFGKSRTCQAMALNPVALAVMDRFLLPNCDAYQINLTQAIAIGPGERKQITHPDDAMFPFVKTDLQAMINVMWAWDDFTAENGATHIAPGSHAWPRDRHADEEHEVIPAVMPAGSFLVYLGSARHGGSANRTASMRRGIVISYCLGWLRQSENQYLAYPQEIVRDFPEPLQRLVGYFIHKPNLGMIEGQNPISLLDGTFDPRSGTRDFMPDHIQEALEDHYTGKTVAVA